MYYIISDTGYFVIGRNQITKLELIATRFRYEEARKMLKYARVNFNPKWRWTMRECREAAE